MKVKPIVYEVDFHHHDVVYDPILGSYRIQCHSYYVTLHANDKLLQLNYLFFWYLLQIQLMLNDKIPIIVLMITKY